MWGWRNRFAYHLHGCTTLVTHTTRWNTSENDYTGSCTISFALLNLYELLDLTIQNAPRHLLFHHSGTKQLKSSLKTTQTTYEAHTLKSGHDFTKNPAYLMKLRNIQTFETILSTISFWLYPTVKASKYLGFTTDSCNRFRMSIISIWYYCKRIIINLNRCSSYTFLELLRNSSK